MFIQLSLTYSISLLYELELLSLITGSIDSLEIEQYLMDSGFFRFYRAYL
jgi:hypothetical protein